MFRLFGKGKAQAKWRSRARLVDPHKTKITLAPTMKPRRIPPWVYRGLQAPGKAVRKRASQIEKE